ncbi:hypothetical protein CVT25_003681 [Psilocybe cyanescens]|uniref:glutathione transferase n=1 Tax=Psilocybe cyanescens TaxID=93625 RepID=A0A409WP42_PSICY|nr:hypothetical protein CVT25_003681 [Psilocybe cyanescens]
MVLILHGVTDATCTRRVGTVLHEKGVQFVLKPVKWLEAEHKTPEYLEKQPFGLVPYIDDDGFILYESRAICHYIATKYAHQGTPELVPTDLKANALFQQAVSIETSNFSEYVEKFVGEKVFKPQNGLVPDEERAKALLSTLGAKLDVYDKILSKQKYLAGDSKTPP